MSSVPSQAKSKRRKKKKKSVAAKAVPAVQASNAEHKGVAQDSPSPVADTPILEADIDAAEEKTHVERPHTSPQLVEEKHSAPLGPAGPPLSAYSELSMTVDADDKEPLSQAELRAVSLAPTLPKATVRAHAPQTKLVSEGGKGVFVIRRLASKLNEMLNADHFATIFSNFDGHTVGKFATVCKKWNEYVVDPMVWRSACTQVWKEGPGMMRKLRQYKDNWKLFYLSESHLRFDGFYLLKTTYRRPGGYADLGTRPTTIVDITYYRYLRFLPGRKVVYGLLNSLWDTYPRPMVLSDKRLSFGQYVLQQPGVRVRLDLPHMAAGMSLSFYQTKDGHHDCLIVEDFQGQSSSDESPVHFVNPATYFHFRSELELKSPS